MQSQYFDCWEFRHIFHLVETNPKEAKRQFDDYFEKYPTDYSAYAYYTYVLIVLGYLDEAEQILNYLKTAYLNDVNFMKHNKKVDLIRDNIIFNTLKLLSYQGKYEELLVFHNDNIQTVKKLNLFSLEFYCKQKLGIQISGEKEKFPYLFKQIANYSEKEFLEHIKKHLSDYNQDKEQPNDSVFVPNFPVNKVLEEVKKYVGSNERLFSGFYEDSYIFKYNGCGRIKNKLVDYFRVIALNNTDCFITMFPSDDCETMPFIDLNYMVPEDFPKTKRLSQIDKFNKRFNRL